MAILAARSAVGVGIRSTVGVSGCCCVTTVDPCESGCEYLRQYTVTFEDGSDVNQAFPPPNDYYYCSRGTIFNRSYLCTWDEVEEAWLSPWYISDWFEGDYVKPPPPPPTIDARYRSKVKLEALCTGSYPWNITLYQESQIDTDDPDDWCLHIPLACCTSCGYRCTGSHCIDPIGKSFPKYGTCGPQYPTYALVS